MRLNKKFITFSPNSIDQSNKPSSNSLKNYHQTTNMGNYKMGFFFTRKFKNKEAEPPADLKEAFARHTDGGNLMSAEQLQQFLINVQGESKATLADAEKIIDQIVQTTHHISKFTRHDLSFEDFFHYLFTVDLNPPIKMEVHHNMTDPMSNYFIYTGHNSYLTGNQLSSDCSDVPIIKALEKGVRVIELDLWPNSSEDDIHVLHGRTLTTPVELIKCLRSIKEHAFTTSPYPVVVTLEDHLTPDLQAKVAEMVTETFGQTLYYPESDLKEFPSPEELKCRIILSTKPPKEYLETKRSKGKRKETKEQPEEEGWGRELEDDDKSDSENEDDDDDDVEDSNRKSHSQGSLEYKRLIGIRAQKHKGNIDESLKVEIDKVRRLSLSEQSLKKACSSHASDIVRFTQRNFLRVYPKGTRVNSSNYNPLTGWLHGAQMVAFNMQGYGRSLWLMQGKFRCNGGCGYVKKPKLLTSLYPPNEIFDPREEELPVKKTLKVKVYMGDGWRLDFSQTHFDSYSPPDFYARVGIAGVTADIMMRKTKPLEDCWIPVWNQEFSFPLTVPELAILRIEVHEYDMSEKDDFAGQTCFPVSEICTGIRAVPLFDHKGEKYKSVRLLMRFDFE